VDEAAAHGHADGLPSAAQNWIASVTKLGGVTEFRKVAALAESNGVALMPHAPYFGPGLGAEPDPEVIKDYRTA
jgi:L-alanine-DL-glutamate epimerase-like enolase superfamily enzyme